MCISQQFYSIQSNVFNEFTCPLSLINFHISIRIHCIVMFSICKSKLCVYHKHIVQSSVKSLTNLHVHVHFLFSYQCPNFHMKQVFNKLSPSEYLMAFFSFACSFLFPLPYSLWLQGRKSESVDGKYSACLGYPTNLLY